MVVGWAISERMTADIVVSALESARARGYVAENAIFHSDRGAQYTSRLLARWADAHHVRLSVGRTGSCHDNAVIAYIEGFYNRRRPHSTIGYRVPAEEMDAFFRRTAGNAAAVEEMLAYGRMAA